MTTASIDDTREDGVMPQDPPPWFVRVAGWTLLGLALAGVLFVSLVRLPESVLCAFTFEPKGGADPIQTRFDGTLEDVRVQPGQTVRAGEILFAVRADEIREGRRSLAEAEEELRSRRARVTQLEAEHRLRIVENGVLAQQARLEIEILAPALTAQRDLLTRFHTNTGTVAQTEIVALQREIAATEKDLGLARARLESLAVERDALQQAWERAQLEEQSAINQWESRRAAALRLLEGTEGDLLVIRAPGDGVVTHVARRQVGSVVQTGEELMRMAEHGAELHVRLAVPERGLGRVTAGQRVRLFFEAYPYERFGTVEARLSWVSPAASAALVRTDPSGQKGFFEAIAEVGPAGAPWSLGPGLAGTARIQVGRRTILEKVFEPVRGLAELVR